jgi:NADH dehydrogenase
MTFVIVGAGPTGVELAGAFSEIARHSLRKDFAHIDPARSRIILLEGVKNVLPSYPEKLSQSARRALEKLGVEVRTETRVTGIDEHGVRIGDERIEARTVLWAAGVAGSPVARSLGAPLDRAGRVRVNPDLTIPGHPEVFVVGDLAALDDKNGKPIPGVAPAAMQMGDQAAANIARSIKGEPLEPFSYFDRGSFSVIGRGQAVGLVFNRYPMSGLFAWLAWLVIHLMFLIGFRNRLAVLLNWAYSFVTMRRGARLITGAPPRLELEGPAQTAPIQPPPSVVSGSRAPPPV